MGWHLWLRRRRRTEPAEVRVLPLTPGAILSRPLQLNSPAAQRGAAAGHIGGERMENRDKNLQEMMQELAQAIERAPEEKKAELRSYISGYLAALEQLKTRTA